QLSQEFLNNLSSVLNTVTTEKEALEKLAALSIPRLGDWCVIRTLENEEIKTVALTHSKPELNSYFLNLDSQYPSSMSDPLGTAKVLRTGEAEIKSTIDDKEFRLYARDENHLKILRSLKLRSYLNVQLLIR